MGQTPFDVSTSWIPGSLGLPTLGSTGGGGCKCFKLQESIISSHIYLSVYEYPQMSEQH